MSAVRAMVQDGWGVKMNKLRRALGIAQDHPLLVNLVLAILVIAHNVLQYWTSFPDLARELNESHKPEPLIALALGLTALAGMTAGFAGVVVIFGLSAGSDRFRRLRLRAGGRLRANWASVVSVAFAAAFLSFVSATLILMGHGWGAVWPLEFALLLALHGAVRLLWLLRALSAAVAADDQDQTDLRLAVSSDDIFART
jgi:hypothetical protein